MVWYHTNSGFKCTDYYNWGMAKVESGYVVLIFFNYYFFLISCFYCISKRYHSYKFLWARLQVFPLFTRSLSVCQPMTILPLQNQQWKLVSLSKVKQICPQKSAICINFSYLWIGYDDWKCNTAKTLSSTDARTLNHNVLGLL